METVIQLLRELERTKFYGSLTVKFEAGHVTVLKKEETIKPPERYRDNRGQANDDNQR